VLIVGYPSWLAEEHIQSLEVKMVCGVMILLVVMVECSWEQETYQLDLVFEFFNIFYFYFYYFKV
jgi:hypothetical protein